MFFPRLRQQAKWMFVFLALVFGVGFVAFGVGSNLGGTGLGDIFSGIGGDTPGASPSEARQRVLDNPNNANAYRDLANALITDGKPEQAIEPLTRYTALRPRDATGLSQLASLYNTKARRLSAEAQVAEEEARSATADTIVRPTVTGPLANIWQSGEIDQSVGNRANARFNEILGEIQTAAKSAQALYTRLIKLEPDEASLHLALATAATQAGDFGGAVNAYRQFLKAAPDDPNAPEVRQRIRQLQQSGSAQQTVNVP